MKLLIITQKVDKEDDILGFFHHWVEKFSEKLEKLYVVCLWQGEYHLPDNVEVFSLGKEEGFSKPYQLFRLQKFLFKHLSEVDGIFVHMCPIYAILSFLLVKIFRKKMILWYVHKSVNWKLKLAEKCVDKILTASEESCRLKNRKKIEIVGHGIDIDQFIPRPTPSDKFRILSVGRIAPVKNLETFIRAIGILVNQKNIKDIRVKIIGWPILTSDRKYFEKIKNLVREKKLENYIEFLGSIPHQKMPEYYQQNDLLISASETGSFDKAVLEAMACGNFVLTPNEAFKEILEERYLFKKRDSEDLAKKIINLKEFTIDKNLREIVIKNHNLDNLIERINSNFK